MVWGAAIGAAGSLIGAGVSAALSDKQAKKQRAWAEKMSSTAYQRGMKDMRLAGLNPILAYKQGGASSPTGSMAPMPNMGAALTSGLNTGAEVAKTYTGMKKTRAETLTEGFRGASEALRPGLMQADLGLRQAQAKQTAEMIELTKRQQIASSATARKTLIENALLEAKMPAAMIRKRIDQSPAGQFLIKADHYTNSAGNIINTATGGLIGYGLGRGLRGAAGPGRRGQVRKRKTPKRRSKDRWNIGDRPNDPYEYNRSPRR